MISRREKRKFESGMRLSPRQLVSQVKKTAEGWNYQAISIGFPSVVQNGRIMRDPKHLGPGWISWDFKKTLGKPVRILNDAAMQALGSYRGGRMLFLGLGTGLGSTLVWPRHLMPLELGDLPYEGGLIEDVLGKPGLESLGKKTWEREVHFCIEHLKLSFIADYVMLGGGNAKLLSKLPAGTELGHNRNAYLGGVRMWETNPRTKRPNWTII
jgi:polyphosphate glucokinase